MATPTTQQYIIRSCVVLLLLSVFYPPWLYVDEHKIGHSLGYAPIWNAPVERASNLVATAQTANALDYNILLLQGVMLCVMTIGCCIALGRSPDKVLYPHK